MSLCEERNIVTLYSFLAPYINESTTGAAAKPHPEDVLVAEATETLELAEEQV